MRDSGSEVKSQAWVGSSTSKVMCTRVIGVMECRQALVSVSTATHPCITVSGATTNHMAKGSRGMRTEVHTMAVSRTE